jgi:hypothetical protein
VSTEVDAKAWELQHLVDNLDLAADIVRPQGFGLGPRAHLVIDNPFMPPLMAAKIIASGYAQGEWGDGIDGELFALEAAIAGYRILEPQNDAARR